MGLIIAVFLIGFIIFFHELGHFALAKANGIRVDEFSLGLGPTLVGKKIGGTLFSLKLLPFGGACMMGEDDADDQSEGSFNSKSVWARISVIAAGPVFNLILAWIFCVILIGAAGYRTAEISDVPAGYSAQEQGLEAGDDGIVGLLAGGLEELGREQLILGLSRHVLRPVLLDDAARDIRRGPHVLLGHRVHGEARALADQRVVDVRDHRDVERAPKEGEVRLLAHARPLARLDANGGQVGTGVGIVDVVRHEVSPRTAHEVGHRVLARHVEAPEVVVARQGDVLAQREVRELIVDSEAGVGNHVAHIDVGHEVAEEKRVDVDHAKGGGPFLAKEPLHVRGMDVPARHA